MSSATKADGVSIAKKAVAAFSQTVSSDTLSFHDDVRYLEAALQNAVNANHLEDVLSDQVRTVAKNITAICGKGWERDKTILRMWHQVALMVTKFSEHLDKPVAALIINEDNELMSFSANRMLKGTPKILDHFVVGGRRTFIPCAEKFAIAKSLSIDTEHHEIPGLSDEDKLTHVKDEVKKLSDDILDAAHEGASFENCFILTTVPSCMSCAEAIGALKFKGVITEEGAGGHFECADEMRAAEKHLRDHNVQIIYLPKLACA